MLVQPVRSVLARARVARATKVMEVYILMVLLWESLVDVLSGASLLMLNE